MPESPLFAIPMLEGGSDYPTPDAAADAKDVNDQFKYVEQFLGVQEVTSGTLPSTPHDQQLIYETDTGRLRYRSGTDWITVSVPTRGSTALRDAHFGAPANAAARVALANLGAAWFNTDTNFGFTQRYFCPTTDSGESGYLAQNARGDGGWMPSVAYERAWGVKTSGTNVVGTSYSQQLTSGSVIFSGGKVRVTCTVYWINPTSGADRVVAVKLLNDAAEVTPQPTQTIIPFFPGASVSNHQVYIWEFTPTAGAHTIELHAQAAVASSVSFGIGSSIKIEEIAG